MSIARRHWPFVLFFCASFIIGFGLRLLNITEVGISAHDSHCYQDIARLWAEGDVRISHKDYIFLRPVVYLIHLFSLKVFGNTDYSIKLIQCILDFFNVCLIFVIGRQLSKNIFVGLFAASLYCLFPHAIYMSRNAMTHVPSAFFLLSTLSLFLYADKRRQNWALYVLPGMTLGLGFLSHGDGALYAPLFALFILWRMCPSQKSWAKWLLSPLKCKQAYAFSLAFFVPLLICWAALGNEVIEGLVRESGHYFAYYDPKYIFIWNKSAIQGRDLLRFVSNLNSISLLTSVFVLVGFFAAIAWLMTRLKNKEQVYRLLPAILVLGYITLFTVMVKAYLSRMPRFSFNLIPLIYLTLGLALIQSRALLKRFQLGTPFLLAVTSFLAVVTLINDRKHIQRALQSTPDPIRQAYNLLGDKVGPNNKLLIVPSIQRHVGRWYNSKAYFGKGNAKYIVDCQGEGIEAYIKKHAIKYAIITTPKTHKKDYLGEPVNGVCMGMDPAKYSVETEIALLQRYLNKKGAKHIYFHPNLGDVYELAPANPKVASY